MAVAGHPAEVRRLREQAQGRHPRGQIGMGGKCLAQPAQIVARFFELAQVFVDVDVAVELA